MQILPLEWQNCQAYNPSKAACFSESRVRLLLHPKQSDLECLLSLYTVCILTFLQVFNISLEAMATISSIWQPENIFTLLTVSCLGRHQKIQGCCFYLCEWNIKWYSRPHVTNRQKKAIWWMTRLLGKVKQLNASLKMGVGEFERSLSTVDECWYLSTHTHTHTHTQRLVSVTGHLDY